MPVFNDPFFIKRVAEIPLFRVQTTFNHKTFGRNKKDYQSILPYLIAKPPFPKRSAIPSPVLAEMATTGTVPPQPSTKTPFSARPVLILSISALGRANFVQSYNKWHTIFFYTIQGFNGLRFYTIFSRNYQNSNIGNQRPLALIEQKASWPGVSKKLFFFLPAYFAFRFVSRNMLGNTPASFGDVCFSYVIKQSGFTMVNMTHTTTIGGRGERFLFLFLLMCS